MTLPVAILAGGLATRLLPVTQTIPKSLVEVAGKPFLVHQLELLRRHDVRRVILCVAHLAEQIEAVAGDGRQLGLEVKYSHDGQELVGTGGALRRALPLLGESFLVLYGDSYLTCNYGHIARTFSDSRALGLMTVFRNEGQYDTSNVLFRDGRIIRYDKTVRMPEMKHIDYGLGAFRADAFAGFPEAGKLDLAQVYETLLARDQLVGLEVTERFYEIGSPAGLEETRQYIEEHP